MKALIIIIFIGFLNWPCHSQGIIDFFKKLPSHCTPELSIKEREILLKKGEYIIAGSDSIETVKYSIDTSTGKNYIRYEYNFTTGQNGFIAFEIRRFKKTDGSFFIVYSRYGGMLRAFEQQELTIYTLKKNELVESKEQLLPKIISLKEFFQKGTPDSIIAYVEKNVNTSFSLYPDIKNTITYNIFPSTPLEYEYSKFITGESINFTWDGKNFIKKLVSN